METESGTGPDPEGTNDRRVVIADPHPSVRDALERLAEKDLRLTVIASVSTVEAAIELTRNHRAGLLILEVRTPGRGVLQAVRELLQERPELRVIVFTGLEDEAWVHASLLAGARGVVSKAVPLNELRAAVTAVRAGEVVVRWHRPRSAIAPLEGEPLSTREEAVFRLIADGWSNDQIGQELEISVKTIESHRRNVMRKLRLTDRRELVQLARRWGLLAPYREDDLDADRGPSSSSTRSASL